jgi:hypothetical protein
MAHKNSQHQHSALERPLLAVRNSIYKGTWRHPIKFVYWPIIAIALFGCGDPAPIQTSLSALKASQVDFNGRYIVVSGTLRTFDAPRHYWIENEALDRVALESANKLAPLVGQTVEVSGIFIYDQNVGRRIEVKQLRTLP